MKGARAFTLQPDARLKSGPPRTTAGTLVALVCTALLSLPVVDPARAQTCGNPAAGEIEIWCAVMTAGTGETQSLLTDEFGTPLTDATGQHLVITHRTTGFQASSGLGTLSNVFTYADDTYTVEGVFVDSRTNIGFLVPVPGEPLPSLSTVRLFFIVEAFQDGAGYTDGPLFDLSRNLTLHIGRRSFALGGHYATLGPYSDRDSVAFAWYDPVVGGVYQPQVTVRLTLGGSAVATLDGLTLDGLTTIDLADTFNIDESGTKNYTATVAGCVSSVTVNPTLSRGDATFEVLDENDMTIEDADSAHGYQVNLDKGTNTFKMRVIPEVGSRIETYTVTVTRKAPAFTATLDSVARRDFENQGVRYRFDVKLCEPVWIPYMDMRDHAFEVTNGTLTKAKRIRRHQRLHKGQVRMFSDHWRMTVEATNPTENVTVALQAKDCDRRGAVCTARGIKLGNSPSLELEAPEQPLNVAVSSTEADEGDGYLKFTVRLTRATADYVEVDFKTVEVTTPNEGEVVATEGEDYWPTPVGRLVFGPGETSQELWVSLVDDDIAEENEVMDVEFTGARLVHRPGGWVKGPVTILSPAFARGTISDSDTMQRSDAMLRSDEPRTALTAAFRDVPASHDGEDAFTFELAFSESIPGLSHETVRDSVLDVTGGRVTKARRLAAPSNRRWEVTVEPVSTADITVGLGPTHDCADNGAVCAGDGRKLANHVHKVIKGPPAISVADARVEEAQGATVDFAVTLSRAATGTVTVDYATSDGTAAAGSDYTEKSGTLTFAPGVTAQTVSVAVLDDSHDEESETFTLTLSNAAGATITDATAIGTIENDDPMPHAWLSRFGRTIATQAIDAIGERMEGGRTAHVTVGGTQLDTRGNLIEPEEGGRPPFFADDFESVRWNPTGRTQSMTTRDLLLGSSFKLSAGGENDAATWTGWGHFATGGFEADVDGTRLDGDVTTGFLGADVGRDRWLVGIALSFTEGDGDFALMRGDDKGEVDSSLTALYPYAKLGVNEKVDVWGLLGFGSGELELTLLKDEHRSQAETYKTDSGMRMGALGVRGEVLSPAESGGLAIAVKSDAFWVRMDSDAVKASDRHGRLEAAEADASRVRLVVEGSRAFDTGTGTLTPSAEIGLRHDGGDAETGTGIELGGALRYQGAGISIEGAVRTLIAHEESGYEEWGASGAIRIQPGSSGRGLSFTLSPTWGAASSGVGRLWGLRDAQGLANDGEFEAECHLEAEIGYGIGVPHSRGLVTPYTALSLAEGGSRTWRSGARWKVAPDSTLGLEATRQETRSSGTQGNAIVFRVQTSW